MLVVPVQCPQRQTKKSPQQIDIVIPRQSETCLIDTEYVDLEMSPASILEHNKEFNRILAVLRHGNSFRFEFSVITPPLVDR